LPTLRHPHQPPRVVERADSQVEVVRQLVADRRAYDKQGRPKASWVATQLNVDRNRCILKYSYHAFFLDSGQQVEGLSVIEYFATESGMVRFGEGFFVDADHQPVKVNERLERISVPHEIGSPEEARIFL
jgi:hypothetical protein